MLRHEGWLVEYVCWALHLVDYVASFKLFSRILVACEFCFYELRQPFCIELLNSLLSAYSSDSIRTE